MAAFAAIPARIRNRMENVAFVVEDAPRRPRRGERGIHGYGTLLGLYEGVPMTRRGPHYGWVLPDKITIFQQPIELLAKGGGDIARIVRDTVWHEVAHHLGMSEPDVWRWESRRTRTRHP